ncbi:MAG TPA: NfeD family protein, partial [Acidimicrobiia bacterium]
PKLGRVRARAVLILIACLGLAACSGNRDGGGIDVIDVSGPLDGRALDFMADSIHRAADDGQVLALLQLDSPAVLDGGGFDRLTAILEDPPLPVATWIGPAPAVAFGGAGLIAQAVEHRAIAPGSEWGITNPVVLGESRAPIIGPDEAAPAAALASTDLEPTVRQYLQHLDGQMFATADGPLEVRTLIAFEGGVTLKPVTFLKPGVVDRFFRLAVLPEAAFFFLVVGLALIVFEHYALGPGFAAGVGGVSVLLGGWGLATLPLRWWGLGLAILGWVLFTWAHQRGGSVTLAVLGTAAFLAGGTHLVDGAGQIDPRWWLILPSVLAVLFFYLLAMPTVQRARLSTMTMGRESLIGMIGKATSDFAPDGVVEVAGARWRATAHREAGLVAGAPVSVTGVDGLYLEVAPAEPRET